jgi:hypothetical protein
VLDLGVALGSSSMPKSLLFLPALLVGCGFSVREQLIRQSLPEVYKEHKTGIISNPSAEDLNQAIELGKASKESEDLYQYAYIEKPGDLHSYIYVKTPLFLLAQHSFECSREYSRIDDEYVDYCKSLDAVKLEFMKQLVTRNYYAFLIPYTLVLLRNGERVESLKNLPSYHGKNPFFKIDAALQAHINSITQQSLQAYPEQYRRIVSSYLEGINQQAGTSIPLTENDHIFSSQELSKPGKYEIVIRTPKTFNVIGSLWDDREIKYPIDFSKFR